MKKWILLSVMVMVTFLSGTLCMLLGLPLNMTKEDVEPVSTVAETTDRGLKVVVDIGHGGDDKGTNNSSYYDSNLVLEKDINLEIGLKLVDALKEEGVDVVTTRTDDTFVSLEDRSKISNESEADLCVSIHSNATVDGNATVEGIETFYYNTEDSSSVVASAIQDNLITALSKKDRGVKRENFQVLRDSDIPAVLVECGFLTNDLEREQLSDGVYQDILVSALVDAILGSMS